MLKLAMNTVGDRCHCTLNRACRVNRTNTVIKSKLKVNSHGQVMFDEFVPLTMSVHMRVCCLSPVGGLA